MDEREKLYMELGRFVYAAVICNLQDGEFKGDREKVWLLDYMLEKCKPTIEELNKSFEESKK